MDIIFLKNLSNPMRTRLAKKRFFDLVVASHADKWPPRSYVKMAAIVVTDVKMLISKLDQVTQMTINELNENKIDKKSDSDSDSDSDNEILDDIFNSHMDFLNFLFKGFARNVSHPLENLTAIVEYCIKNDFNGNFSINAIIIKLDENKYPYLERLIPYMDVMTLFFLIHEIYARSARPVAEAFLNKYYCSVDICQYLNIHRYWNNGPHTELYLKVGMQNPEFMKLILQSGNMLAEIIRFKILDIMSNELYDVKISDRLTIQTTLAFRALLNSNEELFDELMKVENLNVLELLDVLEVRYYFWVNTWSIRKLLSHPSARNLNTLLEIREKLSKCKDKDISFLLHEVNSLLGKMVPYESQQKKIKISFVYDD
jgi:hypothetical protein